MESLDLVLTLILVLIAAVIFWVWRVRNRRRSRPPTVVAALIGVGGCLVVALRALIALLRGETSLWASLLCLVLLAIAAGYHFFRRFQQARRFQREALETRATRLDITQQSPLPKDVSTRTVWLLLYAYLDGYQGSRDISWRQRRLTQALEQRRLRVFVRYLPEDPAVHRLSRIEIGEPEEVSTPKRKATRSGNLGRIEQELLDLSAGPADHVVTFTHRPTGRYVQFTNIGLGSLAMDLPVMELDEQELERARSFFADLDADATQRVPGSLETDLMTVGSQTSEIGFAADTAYGIFTQVFDASPDFDLDISRREP